MGSGHWKQTLVMDIGNGHRKTETGERLLDNGSNNQLDNTDSERDTRHDTYTEVNVDMANNNKGGNIGGSLDMRSMFQQFYEKLEQTYMAECQQIEQ